MNRQEIEQFTKDKLKAILPEIKVKYIKNETNLKDGLSFDPKTTDIDQQFVQACQEDQNFGFCIPDYEVYSATTFKDLVDVVEKEYLIQIGKWTNKIAKK